eukprot:CAMPEP_0181380110 /NCGR_PEP_ID=MMETSP1106-20121128/19364_1 /TAXON_ID=81844 /ORGANISM="Mantoniella antarctica, Strain SL-175" /LENGTH=81 /DNA_ID=CAMNT_0023499107 /DNA_START=100 /DNA_END=342 /DNA_ORIENTATION=+
MDFAGQRLSELMYQITILLFAVLSFAVGYATSSFRTMMLLYAAGVVVAFVIAVPDWPYFNLHPQHWLAVDASHPNWDVKVG